MPVALQDNSFIIPRNSTEKIHFKNIPQKISRQKKQEQKFIFDENIPQKNKFYENIIDFSKYTTERTDLDGEEPSASNNYGYLKLPELTKDDAMKLNQNQSGGERMKDHFNKFFNPRKKDNPNEKLSTSQVLQLFSDLDKAILDSSIINIFIFYDEESEPTEYSYNINGINYVFTLFLFDEIRIKDDIKYYPIVENLNGMIDFIETKKQKEYEEYAFNLRNNYEIKIYDNNNQEYIFDAYYKYGKPFMCGIPKYNDVVSFVKWNKTSFLPKNKLLNSFELQEIFTEYPNNTEFNLIDITEKDKKMIKCYTYTWDKYMNDELWSNSSNLDVDKIDLNKLNNGFSIIDPVELAKLGLEPDEVEPKNYFTELNSEGELIPFGLSFPIIEYNMDKIAYIRKEAKYKNEYYHALMTMKSTTSAIDNSGESYVKYYMKSLNRYEPFRVYRGMTRRFDLTRSGLELNNGGFVNKGFLSTSTQMINAYKFTINKGSNFISNAYRCIYEFTVMPGVPYIAYDSNPFESAFLNENEILIGKNAIINIEDNPYKFYNHVPVIRGTIRYDTNYVKSMNLKYSKIMIKIYPPDKTDLIKFLNFTNEPKKCKWEIKEITSGGRKTRKRRKNKTKKCRHKRLKNRK
jgi:hypothetical protein